MSRMSFSHGVVVTRVDRALRAACRGRGEAEALLPALCREELLGGALYHGPP
jgi:hypothetical protein